MYYIYILYKSTINYVQPYELRNHRNSVLHREKKKESLVTKPSLLKESLINDHSRVINALH